MADLFAAIAEPHRRAILDALIDGEKAVGVPGSSSPSSRRRAGRDHMTRSNGIEAGFDDVAAYLRSVTR